MAAPRPTYAVKAVGVCKGEGRRGTGQAYCVRCKGPAGVRAAVASVAARVAGCPFVTQGTRPRGAACPAGICLLMRAANAKHLAGSCGRHTSCGEERKPEPSTWMQGSEGDLTPCIVGAMPLVGDGGAGEASFVIKHKEGCLPAP